MNKSRKYILAEGVNAQKGLAESNRFNRGASREIQLVGLES